MCLICVAPSVLSKDEERHNIKAGGHTTGQKYNSLALLCSRNQKEGINKQSNYYEELRLLSGVTDVLLNQPPTRPSHPATIELQCKWKGTWLQRHRASSCLEAALGKRKICGPLRKAAPPYKWQSFKLLRGTGFTVLSIFPLGPRYLCGFHPASGEMGEVSRVCFIDKLLVVTGKFLEDHLDGVVWEGRRPFQFFH